MIISEHCSNEQWSSNKPSHVALLAIYAQYRSISVVYLEYCYLATFWLFYIVSLAVADINLGEVRFPCVGYNYIRDDD